MALEDGEMALFGRGALEAARGGGSGRWEGANRRRASGRSGAEVRGRVGVRTGAHPASERERMSRDGEGKRRAPERVHITTIYLFWGGEVCESMYF